MKKNKNNIFLILFLVVLAIVIVLLLNRQDNDDQDYYVQQEDMYLKHYEENEYIPVNISLDQIARIYLQDYVYKLIFNKEEAFDLVETKYRNIKFSSFDDFSAYADSLNSLKFREMSVDKYSITEKDDYRYIDVYDAAGNLFIFKEKGVMQYTVYFDRYTVNNI